MTPTLCQHNILRRQCPICERDDDIAELRAELDRLRAALQLIVDGNEDDDYAVTIASEALGSP